MGDGSDLVGKAANGLLWFVESSWVLGLCRGLIDCASLIGRKGNRLPQTLTTPSPGWRWAGQLQPIQRASPCKHRYLNSSGHSAEWTRSGHFPPTWVWARPGQYPWPFLPSCPALDAAPANAELSCGRSCKSCPSPPPTGQSKPWATPHSMASERTGADSDRQPR